MTAPSGGGFPPVTPLQTGDLDWVHALNMRHQVELSELSMSRLAKLTAAATYARGIVPHAFLIAFDQDCSYDSPNFFWFKARYSRFVYVDRVAVSKTSRGAGLARMLYEDLFGMARQMDQPAIVCEVNADPPNPGSEAFHARLGFHVVGEAVLDGRGKTVRYYIKTL